MGLMDRILKLLKALWQLLWGKPYYRYSALLLTTGAGLLAGPEVWAVVIESVVWAFGAVYGAETPPSKVTLGDSIIPQVVGAILIVVSVILFVIFYLKDRREASDAGISIFQLKDLEDLRHLRKLWINQRDLYEPPKKPNLDDVAMALTAINESGRIVIASSGIAKEFETSFRDDFCKLYKKIMVHKYKLPNYNDSIDNFVCAQAHDLANKMRCNK